MQHMKKICKQVSSSFQHLTVNVRQNSTNKSSLNSLHFAKNFHLERSTTSARLTTNLSILKE